MPPSRRRHRWRDRALALAIAALAPAAMLPASAAAQSIACDPGDLEVRSLDFRGNSAFPDRTLAPKIVTAPSTVSRRLFRVIGERRCLDRQELRTDMLRLQTFYRERGFYEATIDTLVRPAGDDAVRVAFLVREGAPILVDSIAIVGIEELHPDIRRIATSGLPLTVGGRFDKALIEQSIEQLRSRLWNEGYPRADVTRGYTLDSRTRRATVEFTVIPGTFARIAEVRFRVEPAEGREQQIPDRVARRLSGLRIGTRYRDRDLVAAQRNLYQTNAYRHVDVRIVPGEVDSLLVVQIDLREDLMRQLDTELGWGSLDCLRARAVYADKNFLSGARRLEVTSQVSKLGYGRPTETLRDECNWASGGELQKDPFSDSLHYFVGATVRQPLAFGSRFTPAFSIYRERRGEYQAYLRTTLIGGEVSAVRDIGRATPLRLAYSLEYGRTQAEPALLCAAFNRCQRDEQQQLTRAVQPLAVASAGVTRYRTNDLIRPTRGHAVRVELRSSHTAIGSARNLQFNKAVADAIWYVPVGGNVFSARLRLGTVLGTKLDFREPVPYIPPQERLYAGGATSVRGFQQNELGGAVYIARSVPAVDTSTGQYRLDEAVVERVVPTGGNSLVVANFDYRIRSPLFPQLIQYALFTDVGQVWTRNTPNSFLGFRNLKWTPGVGVRAFTPVGPIQVNVAWNPYARPAGPLYFDEPFGGVDEEGNPVPARLLCLTAAPGAGQDVICPATFQPPQSLTFLRQLTFTFSIGPEF
jgi:outer membrane protein assembly factor BamA